jgi:hypothetical protein
MVLLSKFDMCTANNKNMNFKWSNLSLARLNAHFDAFPGGAALNGQMQHYSSWTAFVVDL